MVVIAFNFAALMNEEMVCVWYLYEKSAAARELGLIDIDNGLK